MLQEVNTKHPIFYNRNETKLYIVTAPGIINAINPLPANTEIIELPFNNNNEIDLETLSKALLDKGLYCLLIEAGATFNSFLLANKWVDELDYFIGSKILLDNNAKAGFNLTSNTPLQNGTPLTLIATKTLENDIYLHYAIDAL